MNVDTLITRALSALEKQTRYESPGRMPAIEASTWPEKNARIDCSGFVAWCFRFNRKVDHPLYVKINGGWFETTAIHADGLAATGYFTKLENPKPGAILVYPDYVGSDTKMHQGHIGIVTQVNGNGIRGVSQIIHCSLSAYKQFNDAIRITGPEAWLAHESSIIAWFDGLM